VVAVGLALIAIGAVMIALLPNFVPVLAGEVLQGITGGAIRSAIAAIGLGLVGHRAFNHRVGRNHRYDSLGNAGTAAAMGALGYLVSPGAPFFVSAAICLPAVLALRWIRPNEIDYARARGAAGRREPKAARWRELGKDRRLLAFAACMFLFQFANASILLLASERLASSFKHESELVTSAMVVVPQLVTAALALWISRRANEWGRKPFLMVGFAAVLIRTGLFALAPSPWFQVGIQALDGLTAAVIGIMTPLVVADLTRGTGRYNFTLGAVGTVSMGGAAISTTVAGFLAQTLNFTAGFGLLGVAAAAGLVLLWRLVPETMHAALQDD
jgi:MFS family permease